MNSLQQVSMTRAMIAKVPPRFPSPSDAKAVAAWISSVAPSVLPGVVLADEVTDLIVSRLVAARVAPATIAEALAETGDAWGTSSDPSVEMARAMRSKALLDHPSPRMGRPAKADPGSNAVKIAELETRFLANQHDPEEIARIVKTLLDLLGRHRRAQADARKMHDEVLQASRAGAPALSAYIRRISPQELARLRASPTPSGGGAVRLPPPTPRTSRPRR